MRGVKGTNLARVARAAAAGRLGVPLEGVEVEAIHLRGPLAETLAVEALYLALEGEVVVDLPFDFAHLRRLETFGVAAGVPRTLNPVGDAVVLRVSARP